MNLNNISSIRKKLSLKEIKTYYGDSISFQNLDIQINDKIYEEYDPTIKKEIESNEASVYLFGVTKLGHSVCLNIRGFEPYFYIQVDDNWKISNKNNFINFLETRLGRCFKGINVDKCQLIKRKIFYGFRGDKKNKFIKLSFKNLVTFYTVRKILNQPIKYNGVLKQFVLFEENINIILKFIHTHNINACNWVTFKINEADYETESNTQINFNISSDLLKSEQLPDVAPFLQMSYDIECYSHDQDKFPMAINVNDKVIQIGITFKNSGDLAIKEQVILTLKKCGNINKKNTVVLCYESEEELLLAFSNIIKLTDPDIIYSFNGFGFDDSYIAKRSEILNIKFFNCTKMKNISGSLISNNFSSSAYGTSERKYFSLFGRVNFDLHIHIKKEFPLDGYSLDSVAKHFLTEKIKNCFISLKLNKSNDTVEIYVKDTSSFKIGQIIKISDVINETEQMKILDINTNENYIVSSNTDENISLFTFDENSVINITVQKNPITPRMMFDYYEEGDPEKIKDIAEYCLQDTLIPIHLIDKLNIFMNQIQMSLVTYVPMSFLIVRGQQIKVFSQIMRETLKRGYLIPNITPKNEKFKGATVLDPTTGGYFQPVIVLDFASLYPSIIRAHKLCYSTIVLDKEFDNLEGYEYITIEIDAKDSLELGGIMDYGNSQVNNEGKEIYKFVKNTESILPDILESLIVERKNVKNKMKTEKDPFKLMIYNGFQLALKVSANSIYGFLSAQMLDCTPIAKTVTSIGRQMINNTKNFIDENYKEYKTIYGDSVTEDMPVIIKETTVGKGNGDSVNQTEDVIKTIPIKEICDSYEKIGEKEYGNIATNTNLKVWSANGWTDVKKVIRHKTNKKIYKIRTKYGVVHVTEDHSLLDENCKKIKPEDCIVGKTRLYHNKFKKDKM